MMGFIEYQIFLQYSSLFLSLFLSLTVPPKSSIPNWILNTLEIFIIFKAVGNLLRISRCNGQLSQAISMDTSD